MSVTGLAEQRAEILNRLPIVKWGRSVPWEDGAGLVAYGWIDRDDGRSDFVLVAFLWPAEPLSFTFWTSSAKHSAEIMELLCGDSAGHVDCERAAEVLPGLERTA